MKKTVSLLLLLFCIGFIHSQIIFEMISPEDSLVNEYLKTGSVLKLQLEPHFDNKIHIINSTLSTHDSFYIKTSTIRIISLINNCNYKIWVENTLLKGDFPFGKNSTKINTNEQNIIYYNSLFTNKEMASCIYNLYFNNVNYLSNKSDIETQNSLVEIVNNLKNFDKLILEINSYSDCTEKNPLELSMKRSKAVADYLVSKGIDRNRLKYFAYGATQSKTGCDCSKKCNEAQLQQDRRTEFRIISYK